MKARHSIRGFTLPELLALIAVLIVLMIVLGRFLLPSVTTSGAPAARIKCVSNLKNIGLAFRIFATDNHDQFPAPGLSNQLAVASLTASAHFAFLTNELSTPKILYCPADESRKPAQSFANFTSQNVSYFTSLTANGNHIWQDGIDIAPPFPFWLAGDRNLIINGAPAAPGQLTISPMDQVSWTSELHSHQGNVAMAHGSVQQFTPNRLQQSLKDTASTNILLFP